MFPRIAFTIAVVLVLSLAAFFVRGTFIAERVSYRGGCQRNIAVPYQMFLDHMRALADAGRTDELRKLIVEAQQHAGDAEISRGDGACIFFG
jgi:hypothetical protein